MYEGWGTVGGEKKSPRRRWDTEKRGREMRDGKRQKEMVLNRSTEQERATGGRVGG